MNRNGQKKGYFGRYKAPARLRRYEHEFVKMMNEKGHYSVRFGASGTGSSVFSDAVLTMKGKVYLVEIKSTMKNEVRISGRIKTQIIDMLNICQSNPPLIPLIAIRWKNKRKGKWSLHTFHEVPNLIKYEVPATQSNALKVIYHEK
jgi:Holliday junction resolvase